MVFLENGWSKLFASFITNFQFYFAPTICACRRLEGLVAWAVVQTKPNAANTAIKNLRRQGFEIYNPRFNARSARGGQITWRRTQLFPDYLFVRIGAVWRSINGTTGVLRVLMDREDAPARLPHRLILALKKREDVNGLIVLQKRSKFNVGDKVQLKRGALASLTDAIYDGMSSLERSFILTEMLGSLRRIEVNEGDLIAA